MRREKGGNKMAYVSSFWLHWGMVCMVFALVSAQDSLWDCRDRDDLLREVPADVSMLSDCTRDCTVRTYRAVLKLDNKLTIDFRDSRARQFPEEYCWSPRITCRPDQRLQSVFILLPVDSSVVSGETLRLRISSETNGATLQPHAGHSLFPSECGLRFDVTQHVAARELQASLCVRIIAQEQSTLGRGLMCPPILVTTLEKWNQG